MSSFEFIARHWSRRDAVALVLYPASLLFRLLVALRRQAFRLGLFRSTRLAVPVIVVGNLTVGGSGKTPLVIALAREFARRGLRAGIVSRGYGGTGLAPREVSALGEAADSGDEPLLLAMRSGCPVWVGRDRAAAGAALLAAHPDCTVLLLDDGLQHYALARDFEIAVEDDVVVRRRVQPDVLLNFVVELARSPAGIAERDQGFVRTVAARDGLEDGARGGHRKGRPRSRTP